MSGCVRNAILSYYSYYFCSMQYANFLYAWNTRMTYYICQNLLNITHAHWNQYRRCVPNGILSYNSYYTAVCCVYTVNSVCIFCMHGMPGLLLHLMYASEDTVSQNTTRSMWRFKRVSELEAGNSNYECYTCICTYICGFTLFNTWDTHLTIKTLREHIMARKRSIITT